MYFRLYDLMAMHFNMTQQEVDSTYRTREDYIFALLNYFKSRTCCWNGSTSAMYDIIKAYDQSLAPANTCVEPVVFMQRAGGYEPDASFAAKLNRAADWPAWHADEDCPQADATDDVEERNSKLPAFCALPPPPPDGGTAGPDGGT
jgi:hypothetical protein